MRVAFATTVPVSRQAAWAFAAEFANIGKWDPGVKAAKKARAHCGRFRSHRLGAAQPRAASRPDAQAKLRGALAAPGASGFRPARC